MAKLLALLAFLAAALAVSEAGLVVCYFFRWTVYREGDGKFGVEDVDPSLCTHIIYNMVGLEADGSLVIQDEWEADGLQEIAHLVGLKEENPDLKVILNMGGWEEGSEKWSIVAADPDLRATLIQNVLDYLDEHSFDGFEMDWEYPAQREGSDPANDKENFVILLGEFKEALHAKDLVLFASVAGGIWSTGQSYNVAETAENVDYLNVKTLDLHGTWEGTAGHHAPLLKSSLDLENVNVEASIQYWIDAGAPAEKLILGIPTSGRTYTLRDPEDNELYAPITDGGEPGPLTGQVGYLGYNEICLLLEEHEAIWDDEQMVPHITYDDQWIGYDDVESVTLKAQYAKSMGIAGVSLFALDTDDFKGNCGPAFPLLTAAYNILA